MNKTGAWLAVHALEQIGVRFTFGIPGVHNTELYDALNSSKQITPILVTHEQCAAFMADAVSRTSDSIGCCAIVPAAGMTHAMSGIGEAFLDGIPMLVLSGGIRRDTGRHYQLHDMDQHKVVAGLTKATFLVREHRQVIPTIHQAYEIATSGEPGPVFVELAGDVQMFSGDVDELPMYHRRWRPPTVKLDAIQAAAALLLAARQPGLYLGWGAREATALAIEIAELLGAPVATTLQGLSVFPAQHPLHAGFGFGPPAAPAARHAFAAVDAMLAVGVRFAELATGSYGVRVPTDLIHIDINPAVFDKNYPAKIAIEADAGEALTALRNALRAAGAQPRDASSLTNRIRADKAAFLASWTAKPRTDRVSPGIFFRELRARLADHAFLVADDGNHTFLTAEQFPVHMTKRFVSPTDFNCMGYCVPAAIGIKLANPDAQVVAIIGDGAFLMTGLELLTASTHQLGIVFCVFHDGELAQISQFQGIPLNRKTCTVLGDVKLEGIATATGVAFVPIEHDGEVATKLDEALRLAASGRPVLCDVKIDYSRKSEFTKGVVKVNLSRFPLRQKLRFLGRAAARHVLG